MEKSIISTGNAPAAIGPYSQAIVANGMVFIAGQIGLVPGNRKLIMGGITAQTRQALENVKAILEAAGTTLNHVVKVTIYMTDLSEFEHMNEVYEEFFGDNQPARSTVGVADLPATANVEIEAIAILP
ncbi:MAG: RidA family protein [Chloroflexota bacterium]